ncbi:hypothetical protein [Herbiconiux sp. A18JL235]|uniref:Uncharacterized protein n=1 Tax=Herbiconiux sp. A18JL235 TaxID=3152363 RepID=A0AB39BCY6_9MICO
MSEERGRPAGRGDSLKHFRLLPRRKLPVMPDRGERWGGLLRPATLVAAGIAAVIVAVVLIGVATVRPDTPTTLDGVTAEVTTQIDGLVALLPEDSAPATDEESAVVQACPDGSAEEQAAVTRVLGGVTGLDPAAWSDEVKQHYEADGWYVTTDNPAPADDGGGQAAAPGGATAAPGSVTLELIGKALVPMTVVAAPDGDGSTTLTITSESRCTHTP